MSTLIWIFKNISNFLSAMYRDLRYVLCEFRTSDLNHFLKFESFKSYAIKLAMAIFFVCKLVAYTAVLLIIILPTMFKFFAYFCGSKGVNFLFFYSSLPGVILGAILSALYYVACTCASYVSAIAIVVLLLFLKISGFFTLIINFLANLLPLFIVNFDIYYVIYIDVFSDNSIICSFISEAGLLIYVKYLFPVACFLFFFFKLPALVFVYILRQVNSMLFKVSATLKSATNGLDKTTNTDGEDIISFANDIFEFVEQDKFFVFDGFFNFLIDFSFYTAVFLGIRYLVLKIYRYFKNK